MMYLLYLFCFLIISCDLPSEANRDCNGDSGGVASLDDCGKCAAGNTNIVPNQDKDCDNKCFGDSYTDDCGICDDIAVNDGITCSDCDDSTIELSAEIGSLCNCDGDIVDNCGDCGGEGFQNCMCVNPIDSEFTYIDNNNSFQCNTLGSAPYQLGDQLSCQTLQTEFDICYPEDCGSVKLSDFEGKNILIIYEFDW